MAEALARDGHELPGIRRTLQRELQDAPRVGVQDFAVRLPVRAPVERVPARANHGLARPSATMFDSSPCRGTSVPIGTLRDPGWTLSAGRDDASRAHSDRASCRNRARRPGRRWRALPFAPGVLFCTHEPSAPGVVCYLTPVGAACHGPPLPASSGMRHSQHRPRWLPHTAYGRRARTRGFPRPLHESGGM